MKENENTMPPVDYHTPTTPTPKETVNHPDHYNMHPSGIECITVVRHMTYNLGSAVAYIWRAYIKGNPIEDLKKAIWHINDEIQKIEQDTYQKPEHG